MTAHSSVLAVASPPRPVRDAARAFPPSSLPSSARSVPSVSPAGRATMSAAVQAGVAELRGLQQRGQLPPPQQNQGPSNPLGSASGFLSRSSLANRTAAGHQLSMPSAKHVFRRDANASFANKPRPSPTCTRPQDSQRQDPGDGRIHGSGAGSDSAQRRDEALHLVETLNVGPCAARAPDDDLHLQRLEPNSGIPLRKRTFAHLDLQTHLEGRHVVPINALYSIVLEGQSHDGDVTIPIEGDWIVFGVLIKASPIFCGRAYWVDGKNQWNMIKEDESEEQYSRQGFKVIKASRRRTFTMMDLSAPLGPSGELNGADQVQLTVYEAQNSWVDNGRRKYTGGSGGAFEYLGDHDLGTVVCLLNPKVKKGGKGQRDGPSQRREAAMLDLNPRGKDSLLKIGVARDYKQCEALKRDGARCQDFVDLRTRLSVCPWHMSQGITKTKNKRQEFASGTSSLLKPFAPKQHSEWGFSDGMAMGPRAKSYVSSGGHGSVESSNPSSQCYDVQQHFGRDREEARRRGNKDIRDDVLSAQLRRRHASKTSSVQQSTVASKQSRSKRSLTSSSAHSSSQLPSNVHGDRAVRAALRQVSAAQASNAKRLESVGARSVIPDRSMKGRESPCPRPIESKASRSSQSKKRGAEPSAVYSKLLARHEAPVGSLPKPILYTNKRAKTNSKSSVRPPPGASFYASDESDDDFDAIIVGDDFCEGMAALEARNAAHHDSSQDAATTCHEQPAGAATGSDDSDSDIEIVG